MSDPYELSNLGPGAFEHLVNMLAIRILGPGHTGFGPGSDGGRDGYFEGDAPYPSATENWSGRWYIQSKFHAPHLSKDPQKWLIGQVADEIAAFVKPNSKRRWPDNWIIATNIDPSGVPMTGAFDECKALVEKARPQLSSRFHIWGGRKILDLLALNHEAARYYQHYLTPGHVIAKMMDDLHDSRAEIETIVRYLVVRQLSEQRFTKLQQAGSDADTRPGIHEVFVDLPFRSPEFSIEGLVAEYLVRAAAKNHRYEAAEQDQHWNTWNRHPARARVWFVKGGPGQGKSTIGQYLCQVQRAALILQGGNLRVTPRDRTLAGRVESVARVAQHWPVVPRIPISIELKEYAHWYGEQDRASQRGVLTYLAYKISAGVEQPVLVGTLKRVLGERSWIAVFDGLDEVPSDVKMAVASEIRIFIEDAWLVSGADMLSICTSRPQGYAGEFSELDGPTIELTPLSKQQALACAVPVIRYDRSPEEVEKAIGILKEALGSPSVSELMKTPLQSHIMAVVVRDGNRPPERRWQLFDNFYRVIKRREANRDLPDRKLAKLLREDERLLKSVHNRLGFLLHARAETSEGAQTKLQRGEFQDLVEQAVMQMMEREIKLTVGTLMEATTVRLVLVSTPDDGEHVRFDIRSLQEFFAAEYVYEAVESDELRQRLELILGDSHWREVSHFLISALLENGRHTELAVALQVLTSLDQGSDELSTRIFYRRLARGAIISARLLAEGVLEQDKRLRQQFRSCLEPICAVTDYDVLQPLISVSQPNSREWLISFLVAVVTELRESESIGALVVLTYLVQDDHETQANVSGFLEKMLTRSFNSLLRARLYDDLSEEGSGARLQDWFLGSLIQVLFRDDWDDLEPEILNYILDSLSNSPEQTFNLVNRLGYSQATAHMLRFMTVVENDVRNDLQWISYGLVAVHQITPGVELKYISEYLPDAMLLSPEEVPDFLKMFLHALRFTSEGCIEDFKELVLRLNSMRDKAVLSWLPLRLQSLLPLDFGVEFDHQIMELTRLQDEQIRCIHKEWKIHGENLTRPYGGVEVHREMDLNRWAESMSSLPILSMQVWSGAFWRFSGDDQGKAELERVWSRDYALIIVNKLHSHPSLVGHAFYLLGKLIEILPEQAVELKEFFARNWSVGKWLEPMGTGFHTFELTLPDDSPLLPALLTSVFFTQMPFTSRMASEAERNYLREMLSECVDDVDGLKAVGLDLDNDQDVRVAAMMIYVTLLSEGDVDIALEIFEQLLTWFDINISWYLPSIVRLINLWMNHFDSKTVEIVGRLILLTKDSSVDVSPLEGLLAIWRERSDAPISTAGLVDQWLNG